MRVKFGEKHQVNACTAVIVSMKQQELVAILTLKIMHYRHDDNQ